MRVSLSLSSSSPDSTLSSHLRNQTLATSQTRMAIGKAPPTGYQASNPLVLVLAGLARSGTMRSTPKPRSTPVGTVLKRFTQDRLSQSGFHAQGPRRNCDALPAFSHLPRRPWLSLPSDPSAFAITARPCLMVSLTSHPLMCPLLGGLRPALLPMEFRDDLEVGAPGVPADTGSAAMASRKSNVSWLSLCGIWDDRVRFH